MIKIYFNKEAAKNAIGYELLPINHLLEDKSIQDRYKLLLDKGHEYITYSDIGNCDYVYMPFKYDKNNPYYDKVIKEAKEHNKKIIISYIDDKELDIDVEDSIILKANISLKDMKSNEHCIPVYPNEQINYDKDIKVLTDISIGFCGQVELPILRKNVLDILRKSKYKCSFIERSRYYGFMANKEINRTDFLNNLENNMFSVAIRGVGNFSYRLYEIMMNGRIPIIIGTNNALPDVIDWKRQAVYCEQADIMRLETIISEFIYNNDLSMIQEENRKLWLEYLSPIGFVKNFEKYL